MSIIDNHFKTRTFGLLLLGPGGCGKDTQAEKLLNHYGAGATHISVSDLIKTKMDQDNTFAKFAQPILDKSGLLPDDTVHSLVMGEVLSLNSKGYQGTVILNGYARSRQQACWLRNIFKHPDAVLAVEFYVELKEVIRRAQDRQRPDDQNIRSRFEQYHRNRVAVMRKLSSQGVSVNTLGSGSVSEVHSELLQLMRRHAIDITSHQKELAMRADKCFADVDASAVEEAAAS